ncbi:MAG: flagellar hook-basal body complex protein [Desulfamplus sp.]|nr:flagellar hook-basal body complex protein [Desulfamplus sp.]
MALSSSLFTGTSGLINMGNTMQVISNNIANSNTVGFKKGTSAFADTLSQSISTQAGVGQVGRGIGIGEVAKVFDQGSLESTGNTTDLAIGGDGFFIVNTGANNLYTRAGNFKFDETGQFVNPQGYVVQGWELDSVTGQDVGAIGDIVMKSFTSPPEKSTEITVVANLDAKADSKSDVMANFWDGSIEATTNMENSKYSYQTVVKVYDSLGSPHDVTIYYDKKRSSANGDEWEYMVTTNPADDKRSLVQGTEGQGLLAKGTITFSQSSGDITGLTMYRFEGRIGNLNTYGGENKEENVHFKVANSDVMTVDGYGFTLEYSDTNPNGWSISYDDTTPLTLVHPFDGSAVPAGMGNYGISGGIALSPPLRTPPAVVTAADFGIYILPGSNEENIKIDLNADGEVDLEIKLDKSAATGNKITFDINAEKDIHVQGITGDKYVGETADGNTTIQVNNPMVMTKDFSGIGIAWNTQAIPSPKWDWGTIDPTTGVFTAATITPPNEVPDTMAPYYPDAKLTGDKDKAIIDLDDSGGDNDSDDIVFTFKESLSLVSAPINNSSIVFNITGTNAWTNIEKDELEETGYFDFKTDFLGGDFGTTESDIKFNMGTQYVNQTWTKDAMTTTQFAKASTTVYQAADGYPAGSLEGVDVGIDGTITGLYSNGELIPLFRVGLAKFLNNNGLFSVGGNLFRQTRDSGEAITNKPGENGLGTLSPNSLEMSNVDISEEFVKMITTQRGFQANSKTITTVDDMLNTVIGMKR